MDLDVKQRKVLRPSMAYAYTFSEQTYLNTTTITPKIYEASSKLKKPGKRFSGAVLGLVRGISGILELTGAWSDVGEERGRGHL